MDCDRWRALEIVDITSEAIATTSKRTRTECALKCVDRVKMDQQLFISPQNENLNELYHLLDELVAQARENHAVRDSVLRKLDALHGCARTSEAALAPKVPTQLPIQESSSSIQLFQNFLQRCDESNVETSFVPGDESGAEAVDTLSVLRSQNALLKSQLQQSREETRSALANLETHEFTMAQLTSVLRDRVAAQQLANSKSLAVSTAALSHANSAEFGSYIDAIANTQKLYDLAACCRRLLALFPAHPSSSPSLTPSDST